MKNLKKVPNLVHKKTGYILNGFPRCSFFVNTHANLILFIFVSSSPLDDSAYCQICGSKEFQTDTKSPDFLRKLKIKPGIGRSCRYKIKRPESPHSRTSSCDRWRQEQEELCPADNNLKESVTIEKLFRLPREDLQELFAHEKR